MIKKAVMVLGIIFVAIGLIGFFNDPVFNIFDVNALHNIVHLLTGIVGIAAASMSESASQSFSKVFGIVYALVAVWGFVAMDSLNSIIAVNSADNFLHLVLAVVLLYLGYGARRTEQSM